MLPQDKKMDEYSDQLLDTKETTEILGNNDSRNYFKEAMDKEYSNQGIMEYESVDNDTENQENIPTINNVPQELNMPTAHFGPEKARKPKKKTNKAKKAVTNSKKNFHYLKKLKMKLIDRKENKYHNDVSAKIRRDEKWDESVVLKQKILFDLASMAMLSKIYLYNMKIACLNVYVAENKKGPFVKVCDKITLPHGQERIIKVGGLPWRYMMLEMEKGAPLRDAYKNIELYGIYYKDMDSVLGEGNSGLLFDTAYEIIYQTKNIVDVV